MVRDKVFVNETLQLSGVYQFFWIRRFPPFSLLILFTQSQNARLSVHFHFFLSRIFLFKTNLAGLYNYARTHASAYLKKTLFFCKFLSVGWTICTHASA
jgi:hypothetical protein